MALTKIKLGDYIEFVSIRCGIPNLKNDDISGINKEKEFFEPSNQVGEDTSKYKIVPPGYFACNLMHVGRDVVLPIAYNHSSKNKIVSPAYFVFKFRENKDILSECFFLYLKSYERDRFFWFNTDASIRDGMSWEDLCDIDIELPPLEIQKKYVDIYNAMVANQQSYEQGLDDLKLAMDSFYDKFKSCQTKKIAEIIKTRSNKNTDFSVPFSQLRGINESGEFTTTRDSIRADDIDKYLIVDNETYAVNFMCLGNFGKFYLAYNDFGEEYLVSPACNMFQLIDKSIDPYYFTYVLQRSEFQRKCVFYGDGNTRGGINIADFSNIEIPVPSKDEQTIISNLYRSFENRRKLNDKLKNQLKDICPILIKGAIEEAK